MSSRNESSVDSAMRKQSRETALKLRFGGAKVTLLEPYVTCSHNLMLNLRSKGGRPKPAASARDLLTESPTLRQTSSLKCLLQDPDRRKVSKGGHTTKAATARMEEAFGKTVEEVAKQRTFFKRDWRYTKLKDFTKVSYNYNTKTCSTPNNEVNARHKLNATQPTELSRTQLLRSKLNTCNVSFNQQPFSVSTQETRSLDVLKNIAALHNNDTTYQTSSSKNSSRELPAFSDRYDKCCAYWLTKLVASRNKRMIDLLYKSKPERPKIIIKQTLTHPTNAIKNIVKKMRDMGGLRLTLRGKRSSVSDYEKRQRRLEYGKWYLKPDDFGRNMKMVTK